MKINNQNLSQNCHRAQGYKENLRTRMTKFQITGAAATEAREDTVPCRA